MASGIIPDYSALSGRVHALLGRMDTLRYLSVCSGIEAASVAWHPLGWQPVGFAEIEPFPAHVLHHRFSAGRPMFMPDPGKVRDAKKQRARAAALRSVQRIPEHGAVPNFGDLNQFHRWPDAAFDVLVGGTPCQSFSVAGLRQGLRDPRGNLALVYLALADRYRPRWLVWENVPGVLSSNEGRDFGAFLGGMAQLGYGFAWRVLDAQFVRTRRFGWAVPQRRRRVFVVGYLGDWRRAAAVLFDRESLRGDPPPRREAGQAPAGDADASAAGGGRPGLITMAHGQGNAEIGIDHGPTLTCNHEAPIVAHSLRGEGFDASEDGTGRDTPLVPVRHPIAIQERAVSENPDTGPNGVGVRSDGASYTLEARSVSQAVAFDCKASTAQADISGATPTLRAMGHAGSHANAGGQLAVAFDAQAGGDTGFAVGDVAGALHGGGKHGGRAAVAYGLTTEQTPKCQEECALTLTKQSPTGGGQPQAVAFDMRGREGGAQPEGPHNTANIRAASGGSSRSYLALPWAVRRLTPRECERLQGFPDDFTLVPYRGRPAADGPRYKALGNSMAVNVMEWVGMRIALVEGLADDP